VLVLVTVQKHGASDNTIKRGSFFYIILGRDVLEELGIIIDFKSKQITWDEISVPMRTMNAVQHDGYFIHDSNIIAEATARTTRILDAHYEAADIDDKIATCHNLENQTKRTTQNFTDRV